MSRAMQYWWLHDARWYQEVASRFGAEAANEINQDALAFVARRVAQNVARAERTPVRDRSWDEIVEAIRSCPEQMWPDEFVEYTYESPEEGELVTKLHKNFALRMSRTAGTLETYACPCLRLRAAWYDGLGLDVAEDRVEGCLKDGADACTYRVRFNGVADGDGSDGSGDGTAGTGDGAGG